MVAPIWFSDLRGFTRLSDLLPGADVLALLNAYFGILTGAISANGGEILKFIGDGLLAVFPVNRDGGERAAANAALAAATRALRELDDMNRAPPPELAGIDGWQPLTTGIALHYGEVFFGNVGGADRLDFTVIGRAVNAASRVEQLTKALNRPLLVTEPVARLLDTPVVALGSHDLRGVSGSIGAFGVATGAGG